MPERPGTVHVTVAILFASLLVESRGLLAASRLPLGAAAWTLNMAVTSLNPVDPYFLTHWSNPVESLLAVLKGYARPLALSCSALRAYREASQTRRSLPAQV